MRMSFGRAAVCLAVFSLAAFAQSERGTITGVVHDSSGAVVPGAKVNIIHQATRVNTSATTNGAGEYTAGELQIGIYTVRVEKEGFRSFNVSGVVLNAAQTVRADATLEVGQATQTVEVTASAIQVQSEDAKLSTTVQQKLINDLPLEVNGTVRTPFDLAATHAGRQEPRRRQRFRPRRRAGSRLRHLARRRFHQHQPRSLEELGVLECAFGGSHRAVHGGHQRVSRPNIGHAGGGNMTYVVEVRHQRIPRRRLRVRPQQRFRRQQLLQQHRRHRQLDLQAERFRRHGGRTGVDSQGLQRQEQDVLLLLLRGVPQPHRCQRHVVHRSHAGNVQRRFQQMGHLGRSANPHLQSSQPGAECRWNLHPHAVPRQR